MNFKINNCSNNEAFDILKNKQTIFNINDYDYDLNDSETFNFFGVYYYNINNIDKMKKYFIQGIKKSNLNCIYNLGLYYFENKNIELAKKYLLMYLQFRYELNFDAKSEDYKELVIQILTQENIDPITLDLEDIEILNILGLYHKIIKKDINKSYDYYLKEIEKKFNIELGNCFDKQFVVEIFNKKDINIENFDLDNRNILDVLGLYFEKVQKNKQMVLQLYNKGINLGHIDYYNKLSIFYKNLGRNDKSEKFLLNYKLKIMENKFGLNFDKKSIEFKKLFLEIFNNNCNDLTNGNLTNGDLTNSDLTNDDLTNGDLTYYDLTNYDLNDYNVLYLIGLYYGLVKKNIIIAKNYLINSLNLKYDLVYNKNCEKTINFLYDSFYQSEIDIIKKNNFNIDFNINFETIFDNDFNNDNFSNNISKKVFNIKNYDFNNSDILCGIGLYYLHYIEDQEKAIEYFLKSISRQNYYSMYNLGMLYKNNLNQELSLKYLTMYLEFRYELDLDSNTYSYKNKLVDIFLQDNLILDNYELDNVETLKIIGIYYLVIKNNVELSNEYLKKSIEYEYDIKFCQLEKSTNINVIIEIFNKKEINSNDYNLTDREILYLLGCYYYKKSINYNLSEKYYLLSNELGYIESYYRLGLLYKYNIKNTQLMVKYLELGINNNHQKCILLLAKYYEKIKNYKQMELLYCKGVKNDCTESRFKLGFYYYKSKIIKNYKLMKKLLILAIDDSTGDEFIDMEKKASLILGMYYKDIVFNKSILNSQVETETKIETKIESESEAESEAETKSDSIQTDLLVCDNDSINLDWMIKYFKHAISLGCEKSMEELGNYYLDVVKNYKLGVYYHKKATKINHIPSMKKLGLFYKYAIKNNLIINNSGVDSSVNSSVNSDIELDSDSSVELSLDPNSDSNSNSESSLNSNKKYLTKAKKYFRKAVKYDCVESMYELGDLFENNKKYFIAKNYYLKAINLGCVKSMYRLGLYCLNLNKNTDAEKYLKMASELNHIDFLIEYSNYLYSNEKYAHNYMMAFKYYLKLFYLNNYSFINKMILSYYKSTEKKNIKQEEKEEYIDNLLIKINEISDNVDGNKLKISIGDLLCEVAQYHKKISKNENLVIKYYLLGINMGSQIAYDELSSNKSDLKIFNLLITISEDKKNNFIKSKISNLLVKPEIQSYNNKIILFEKLNNIRECIVCYENKLHINFECGHDICINCYCNMTNCQFRCSKNNVFRPNVFPATTNPFPNISEYDYYDGVNIRRNNMSLLDYVESEE